MDLNLVKPNFSTFDHFDPKSGLAISAKTMDTVGSKTYQKPSKITNQLNKYIDRMADFEKDSKGKFVLNNSDIKFKQMMLAIPANTSKAQMDAILKSVEYAKGKNITLTITKIH